jgi:hypothetical protein
MMMLTTVCVIGLLSFCISLAQIAPISPQSELGKRQAFAVGDFKYDFEIPVTDLNVNGVRTRPLTSAEMPALGLESLSYRMIDMDPCSVNGPHIHPVDSEFIFGLTNNFSVGVVGSNGAPVFLNDVQEEEATWFPMGM